MLTNWRKQLIEITLAPNQIVAQAYSQHQQIKVHFKYKYEFSCQTRQPKQFGDLNDLRLFVLILISFTHNQWIPFLVKWLQNLTPSIWSKQAMQQGVIKILAGQKDGQHLVKVAGWQHPPGETCPLQVGYSNCHQLCYLLDSRLRTRNSKQLYKISSIYH